MVILTGSYRASASYSIEREGLWVRFVYWCKFSGRTADHARRAFAGV